MIPGRLNPRAPAGGSPFPDRADCDRRAGLARAAHNTFVATVGRLLRTLPPCPVTLNLERVPSSLDGREFVSLKTGGKPWSCGFALMARLSAWLSVAGRTL